MSEMSVSVRHATEDDALGIARVHVTTRQVSYRGIVPDGSLDGLSVPARAQRWQRILTARAATRQCVLVAEAPPGRIVGFACAGPQGAVGGAESGDPAYAAEITGLYVLPAVQRQGIGAALLRAVACYLAGIGARSAFLWCLAQGPAVPFYEKLGGHPVRSKQESMGGKTLDVVGYGWDDISVLLPQPAAPANAV